MATSHPLAGELVAGALLEELGISVDGGLILTLHLERTTEVIKRHRIGIIIADGVLVGRRGSCRHIQFTVASSELVGDLSTQFAVFARVKFIIDSAICFRSIKILAAAELLIGFGEFGSLAATQSEEEECEQQSGGNRLEMTHIHTKKTPDDQKNYIIGR